MKKSVIQKTFFKFIFLGSALLLSTQVFCQTLDAIDANETQVIRLRQMNGSQSKDSLSVKTTSNTIIWDSWGIGQTTEKYHNTKFGYTFDIQTQFVNLSYTTGESWTVTFGAGVPSGTGKIKTCSNTEYKSSTVSGVGYFAVFGLEIGIFEFLVGHRVKNIEYSKFKSGSTTLDTKYKVSGSQTLFGLGLSFVW